MENELLIYTRKDTGRFQYVVDFIFRKLLGIKVLITDQEDILMKHQGSKLVYSTKSKQDLPWIWSHSLLFESDIRQQDVKVSYYQKTAVFFQHPPDVAPLLPFDPFATAFYMMSRYEEYLATNYDRYGRFTANQSLAFLNNFLKVPVVHLWAKQVGETLAQLYPDLTFNRSEYSFTPTLDIDNAYAYKEKGMVRTLAASLRDLANFNFTSFNDRLSVLVGRKLDPYDSFDEVIKLHSDNKLKPIIFWLVGDYGKHDKNISARNSRFQSLIRKMASVSTTGLHPSFASAENNSLLEEKNRLEEITKDRITNSRMHYLRVCLPETYEKLIEIGIKNDFSMGFADQSGFRAGVTIPFKFYHLRNEQITGLVVHPFCIMDATLKYHNQMSLEEAWEEIKEMISVVKQVKGTFYPIFHNESLGGKKMWKGWKEMYQKMLVEGSSDID